MLVRHVSKIVPLLGCAMDALKLMLRNAPKNGSLRPITRSLSCGTTSHTCATVFRFSVLVFLLSDLRHRTYSVLLSDMHRGTYPTREYLTRPPKHWIALDGTRDTHWNNSRADPARRVPATRLIRVLSHRLCARQKISAAAVLFKSPIYEIQHGMPAISMRTWHSFRCIDCVPHVNDPFTRRLRCALIHNSHNAVKCHAWIASMLCPIDRINKRALLPQHKWVGWLVWSLFALAGMFCQFSVIRGSIWVTLETSVKHAAETIPSSSADAGRRYPPILYPQLSGTNGGLPHNDTWYAISANVDMRLLAYGQPPPVTLVVAGPLAELRAGRNWYARIVILRTGATVAHATCHIPYNAREHELITTHATAIVACADVATWTKMRGVSDEIGVCLVPDADTECHLSSIVPVGVPPRYPLYPYAWADRYLGGDITPNEHTAGFKHAESEYREGRGRIALCVPGVRGDQYVASFPFFLDHYHRMGVDAVFLYMHQPGARFVSLVNSITGQQESGTDKGRPNLVILPWCLQRGATFGCKPRQAMIESPGYWDVTGPNHGQSLAHQDCLFRAFGTYRWVVYVDLDEFILPQRTNVLNLRDLVGASLRGRPRYAPAEIQFRSAFYKTCLPDNTSVAISSSINLDNRDIINLPWPMWAAARVSEIFRQKVRSKFMCDPFGCDGVGVHYAIKPFCARRARNASSTWFEACDFMVAPIKDAIIHHTRVERGGRDQMTQCSYMRGVHELDWTMLIHSYQRLGVR